LETVKNLDGEDAMSGDGEEHHKAAEPTPQNKSIADALAV